MNQFVVPQFIDVEDKILGPITVRQFVIMLAAGLLDFLFYKLFDFALFLIVAIPFTLVAGIIAFLKVNGQNFHLFLLNLFQTMRKPANRVWNKNLKESALKTKMEAPPSPPPPPIPKKEFVGKSKLSELSLLINTGGRYVPEE
jgi:hypothetical protein